MIKSFLNRLALPLFLAWLLFILSVSEGSSLSEAEEITKDASQAPVQTQAGDQPAPYIESKGGTITIQVESTSTEPVARTSGEEDEYHFEEADILEEELPIIMEASSQQSSGPEPERFRAGREPGTEGKEGEEKR